MLTVNLGEAVAKHGKEEVAKALSLLDWTPPKIEGKTFDKKLDGPRLNKQSKLVFDLMIDGRCRTLGEISAETKAPEASVSARLREFRKKGFIVSKRRLGDDAGGHYAYRVTRPQGEDNAGNVEKPRG